MGMALKIKIILLERNMTIKELAEKLGTSGNNLSNKLRNKTFRVSELAEIMDILGYDIYLKKKS